MLSLAAVAFVVSTLRTHHSLLDSYRYLPELDMSTMSPSMPTDSIAGLRNRLDELESQVEQSRQQSTQRIRSSTDALKSEIRGILDKVDVLVKEKRSLEDEIRSLRIARAPIPSASAMENSTTAVDNGASGSTGDGTFAYSFIVGGCNPRDGQYLHYLYNILVATKILREHGSKADVVIFLQIAHKAKIDQLPTEDTRLLDAMGIKYRYIPKDPDESFYKLTLDKFRILTLTEYDRVLFMDGDVMPRQNLDYLFELSMKGVFRENLVVAGHIEPANAGFFMLKPSPGDYELIQQLIHDKEVRGTELPYPHWDNVTGWGHVIEDPDYYEFVTGEKKQLWDFYCAFSDQGLLLHWVKYVKKSVTFVMRDWTENWVPFPNGTMHGGEGVVMLETMKEYSPMLKCWFRQLFFKSCKPPHSDYMHFSGQKKPWLVGPPENLTETNMDHSGRNTWFYHLRELNSTLEMKLDFSQWRTHQRPVLGLYPKHTDVAKAVNKKKKEMEPSNKASEMAPASNTTADDQSPQKQQSPDEGIDETKSKFAYVFVIGGCNPKEGSYRHFIYNILISTKILHEHGSRADIVVFIQLSNKYDGEELPSEDRRVLDAMGVEIRYIPKDPHESFYTVTLEKFRVLTLVEYERVMFLDGDVLPRQSLDYLFELSVNGTFKENVIMAGYLEPANAGLFVVKPMPGDYEHALKLINESHSRGATLPYPHWDVDVGWGTRMDEPDYYELIKGEIQHKWDFHCAYADQGLLYHWVKYVKQSMTVVMSDWTENWVPYPNGTMHGKEDIVRLNDLMKYSEPRECWNRQSTYKSCKPPHSDFMHFTGKKKPWLKGPPANLTEGSASFEDESRRFWFSELAQLNSRLGMNLDFEKYPTHQRPALGITLAPHYLRDVVVRKHGPLIEDATPHI